MLIVAGWATVWHPAISRIARPDDSAFQPDRIARGAELAAIGDCAVCHTADGGRPYAGGRGIPTPFGTVYATNITPDPRTGIGTWSEAAFRRAMRDGIDRAGRHLYPVLPYPHFTRASDADIAAMYAFLMTRAPVRQTPPRNRLPFPLNNRILLAGWNLLYLRPGPWQPDPAHDADWNRGAYLVEAIGHCGACHTPHNALGAERGALALGGGEAEHWYAPALQAASPARDPWTRDALATYLRTGFQAQHGAAAGPMTAVTEELAQVPEADIRAIARYIAFFMPKAAPEPPHTRTSGDQPAAAMFAGACGGCHAADAPMTRSGAPPLSFGTAVNAPTPQDVIEIILHGIPWREGKAAPYMPAFGDALTDAQVADLAGYVRAHDSDKPPWTDLPAAVARARQGGGAS
ncbi:cytochrome c [Rhodopila sp.]|uniref:cytochrome c n=1 Tax=Rhodopila sp. TaxID=2480087 RepID=UPI003D09F589